MPQSSSDSRTDSTWDGTGRITPFLYLGIIGTLTAVLVADLYTPLGVTVWVLYLIPVAMTLWTWQPAVPLMVATVATALIGVTFQTDDGGFSREFATANRSFGLMTVWVTAIIGFSFIKNKLSVRRHDWLQQRQMDLSTALGGEQRIDDIGANTLKRLAESTGALIGVFYARDGGGFRRVAGYAVPADATIIEEFQPGDGLLGQAVKDRHRFVVNDVSREYLAIASALGRGHPRHLVIAPAVADGVVSAVIELGYTVSVDERNLELFERVSETIAVAVRSANYRTHLQNLLEETQRQSEELQTQSEELRVSNEELEEQSRALKESQVRLEEQQAELVQINSQLEEQTQLLENQKDDLVRTKKSLELQTRELDQASRYKSDFLANMSHELRTPLNSSLILAKLLADNPQGNLTEEQVKFATTIQAAGNDLLMLINDILDLSKIEAGRMEIVAERVQLNSIVESLTRTFDPLAAEKGLLLVTEITADAPDVLTSDRQRLEQILKNLLSNAIKFTLAGEVALRIRSAANHSIAFEVSDTGIGIEPHQLDMVFEAFRQADGTTNRKYGGSGLGLSISRQLARLLGGEVSVSSKVGTGSTFTVTIPIEYDPAKVAPRTMPRPAAAGKPVADKPVTQLPKPRRRILEPDSPFDPLTITPAPVRRTRVADDRDHLDTEKRTLLVVEDDEMFAKILHDLSHELGFQSLVAMTAQEALAMAQQYLPHAIVLDIGLPDHSGLAVLDRLKHDARTRHIPVHVVSAGDYAQTALSLGAVGYLLKPVKREELAEAMGRLEMRLDQQVRRVLVVEDDEVQRESVGKLLATNDVETVGVGTAADCLARLRETTFDCMVMDLSLPDASGFTLLETLSREDAYSFPPVIVYTGRDLSSEEEQRLRRYSKSIIIKGAKSPERLLDEVTLFLHQVVAELPPEQQKMLEKARSRDAALEGRRVLVVEDDVRNVFALTSVLEPRGANVEIARNGREAITLLERSLADPTKKVDLVLMDVMMPEMDGLTATKTLRSSPEWAKLPIIMLTAKAMPGDQQKCLAAGANDYLAKPLDIEKLLSLVRVWMPR